MSFFCKSYRVERRGLLRRISISNFWRTEVYTSCHSFKRMFPMVKRCCLDLSANRNLERACPSAPARLWMWPTPARLFCPRGRGFR
jgi:hypothetical protein